ncbi:sulfur oxidation c-type cytochrome SoxX [Comamonas aquatilis]|uniref:sulfur oxidation c-type cytochrome SoxX n=1 Tax=Comamonas aquatilis TaxID=1778406 RepID=UPI0039EE2DA4
MLKKKHISALQMAAAVTASLIVLGCASVDSAATLDTMTQQMVKTSFRDQGIAKVDRLQQDESNAACSAADASGTPLSEAQSKTIEAANLKTVQWPKDGKFIGDWKEGEKIAQNGRGMTWTDKPGSANGGNCYNCHQISPQEISFGTLGPSLYNYGKLRGIQDTSSPEARAIVEYTWGKIWNAKAYNACSGMPRFGHSGILAEAQVRDVVALLLDPKSPVNR